MDAPPRRIDLRVLAPLAKTGAHSFYGLLHADDASDFFGLNKQWFHIRFSHFKYIG
jgi:hypothetical protein